MSIDNKQQIKNFFKKTKKSVAKVQKDMTESAMVHLFEKSPHAESEYDANHKVQINNGIVSSHNPPTFNEAVSLMIHNQETQKAESIECGDRLEIFNTTSHNKEVEYGGPTWKREGYYTYQRALFNLMRDYEHVTR